MTQQISPFLEGKYGWALGESNWNLGMDDNLLKFSYLFQRTVDDIVSTLPTAISGTAYFLTTDNRIYYAVSNTWYSTPVPTWFEFKKKSSGDVYLFTGTSVVQIPTTSGFAADLLNSSNTSKGSSLVGHEGRSLKAKLDDEKSVLDFGPVDTLANRTSTFQAAFNGATNLYIPPGTYDIGPITVPSTVKRVRGAGDATTIRASGTIASGTPFIFCNSNVDLNFGELRVSVDQATYPLVPALQFGSLVRGIVSGIHLPLGGRIAIYAPGCQGTLFENITCDSFGESLFIAADVAPSNLTLNNLKGGSGTGHTINITGGTGHTVNRCVVGGGGASFFGISLYQASDSTVSNCSVSATFREGIQMTDGDRNSCINNRVACQPGHQDFGISIFSDGTNIKNNIVSGNLVINSGASGIGVSASYTPVARTCQLCTISDNTIINPNQVNNVYGAGVLLLGGATCTGNIIQNNACFDESNKMRYSANEWNSGGNPNNNKLINNPGFGGAVFISEGNVVGALSEVYDLTPFTHTPTITATTGTITSATGSIKYRRQGKFVELVGSITITNNGTGAGVLVASHPFTGIISGVFNGRGQAVSNKQIQGSPQSAGTYALRNYDGTYPAATGETILVSGTIAIP